MLGIDAGASGALCALDPGTNRTAFIDAKRKPLDIIHWLDSVRDNADGIYAAIEDVHALFKVSAGSNFKHGFNIGFMHGLLSAKGIGYELVKPKAWQKAVGVKPKSTKRDVANLCTQMYPHAEIYGPRGGLMDGRSDSLMIAHYLKEKYGVIK